MVFLEKNDGAYYDARSDFFFHDIFIQPHNLCVSPNCNTIGNNYRK